MEFLDMLTNDNETIITKISKEVLPEVFSKVIFEITKDIPEWQKEYIFNRDDDIWNYAKSKGNEAILEEDIWKTATIKKEVDIRALDLAALLKLLQYRLLFYNRNDINHKIVKNPKLYKSFNKLIKFTRKNFRNASAHSSLADKEKGSFSDNEKIYNDYLCKEKDFLQQAIDDCESYLRCGNEVKGVLEKFIETEWEPILNAYYTAKIGDDIDYTYDGTISIEDLASYNIIVDYSVFFQDDEYEGITRFGVFNKTIFAEKTLLERLEEIQRKGNPNDSARAKKISKTLEAWIDAKKLIILKNANVIEKLRQVKKGKWCVLTADSFLANDVWDMQKKNVIVVKPKSRNSYEIFRPDSKFMFEIASSKEESKFEETKCIEESEKNDTVQYITERVVHEEKAGQYKFDLEYIPEEETKVYLGNLSRTEKLKELVSEGGEGKIYNGMNFGKRYSKIYKAEQLSPLRVKKIEAMVAYKKNIGDEICWPQDVLYHGGYEDEKYFVGYSMRKAGMEGNEILGTIRQVVIRIAKGEYQWERKDLVELCYNCAQVFEGLHESEILMGDVNPDNIMVDEDKNVYFIDTDSYQFKEFLCTVGTPEFTSPEMIRKMGIGNLENSDTPKRGYSDVPRTLKDEYFATAVLYFYILFLSELPYKIDAGINAEECILKRQFRFKKEKEKKRNYIWQNLTHNLQEMFLDNFTSKKRYSDAEWMYAFNAMLKMKEHTEFERELSNEIFPSSAIEREGEVWEELTCEECKETFKIARFPNSIIQSHEKECPRCKVRKKMLQKRICKLKCPSCNEIWTVNGWDIKKNPSVDLKCPDCDDSFYYSNKNEFEEKESDLDGLKREVERRMSYAFKYKEGWS